MTLGCRAKMRPRGSSRLGSMPRFVALPLVLCLGLLALFGLGACGEEDAQLLGGETAREINANLETVQQLADEGDCVGAESAVEQVGEQIDALEEVDPRLKQALEEGAERLGEVIETCEESTEEGIGQARIPDEDEDEEEPAEEDEKGDGKEGDKGKGQGDRGSGGEGEAPEAENPAPPPSEGEGKGKGPEGEGPPGQDEGGEEGPSGGLSPGSAVEEGE